MNVFILRIHGYHIKLIINYLQSDTCFVRVASRWIEISGKNLFSNSSIIRVYKLAAFNGTSCRRKLYFAVIDGDFLRDFRR